jgi:parvulin-like peptidyl-prolyl isomerase
MAKSGMHTKWLLAVLLLFGCAGDRDPVLVEVGPTQVKLSEFQRAFDEIVVQKIGYEADSASARRFLQAYIDKTVIEQVAADSIPWTPLLEHRARNALEMAMVERQRSDVYLRPALLDDQALRKVYEKGRTRYHYRAIAFPTSAEADAALRELREGTIFDRVAERSPAGGAKSDQGWQTVLTAPEALIDAVAELAPGGFGGPIYTPGKHWVVQSVESAPNLELKPFDQVISDLRRKCQVERGGLLLEAFNARLLKDYQYQTDMANVIWLTQLLRDATRSISRQYAPPTHPDGTPITDPVTDVAPWSADSCPIPREDWKRIIATSSADTVTAVLLLDHLLTKLSFTWPTFESPDHVLQLTRELMLDRLERAEAWAKGYDKLPDLAWSGLKARQLIHTRQFYVRKIYNQSRPSMARARAWYEEHSREYYQPGRCRGIQVITPTWDAALAAQKLLAQTRGAEEALAAVKRALPDAQVSTPAGVAIVEGQVASTVEQQIFGARVGQVLDPLPVPSGFAVFRVEEIEPGRTPAFEDVAEKVTEKLGDQTADSLFKAILTQRRAVTPVRIQERVLRKVKFVAPATEAPAAGKK